MIFQFEVTATMTLLTRLSMAINSMEFLHSAHVQIRDACIGL